MQILEQLAEALEHLAQALGRIHELEGHLAKESHKSSKPPSSDGPGRKPRGPRQRSERKTGGQPGHAGHSLLQRANPDEVLRHRPVVCVHCQQPVEGVTGQLKDRRQVHDLPEGRHRFVQCFRASTRLAYAASSLGTIIQNSGIHIVLIIKGKTWV